MSATKQNIQHIFIFAALSLSLLGCGGGEAEPTATTTPPPQEPATDTPEPTPEPSDTPTAEPSPTEDTGYDRALLFTGKWEGEWRNTTFGSRGGIEAEAFANPDGTASFSIDLGGLVFGALDPDPQTYSGTFDAEGAYFQILDDPVFGEVLITILSSGEVSMTADLIPDPGIATMEATGALTPDELTATYTITFIGGGQASGEVTLTKVEP